MNSQALKDYCDDAEMLMYQVLKELTRNKIPMIYKGGLITKYTLIQNQKCDLLRNTSDIDANWIGKNPTMEDIRKKIEESVLAVYPNCSVVIFREFDENHSAGLKVIDADQKTLFKFDIDVFRPVAGISFLKIDDIEIQCVDAKQIIADKICAISGKTVFRRTKDMIDLYALSSFIPFTKEEILEISKTVNHEIQNFDNFLNRKEELRHAYETLKMSGTKPEFDTIYDTLLEKIAEFLPEMEETLEDRED